MRAEQGGRPALSPLRVFAGCLTAVLLLAGGVAAPAGRVQAKAAAVSGLPTLTWFDNLGNTGLTQSRDPAYNGALQPAAVRAVDAGLVRLDYPSLRVVPDLATWTVSGGGTIYTFHLRRNARFSNGDPVSADDAAWSITRAVRPSTGSTGSFGGYLFSGIAGVQAFVKGKSPVLRGVQELDAHTLRITLTAPESWFLIALAMPPASVLDRSVLEGQPLDAMTSRCIDNVGAGPFQFSCSGPEASVTSFYPDRNHPGSLLVPNPHFYGPRPRIRVSLPIVPDLPAAWREVTSDRLDAAPISDAHTTQVATRGLTVERVPGLGTIYLVPDLVLPPFRSIACRLAVAYALDRSTIARVWGLAAPSFGALPPGLPGGGYLGSEPDLPSYNPGRAKSYLRQCPGRLQHLSVFYLSGVGASSQMAAALGVVGSDLAAIGAHMAPLGTSNYNTVAQQPGMAQSGTPMLIQTWFVDYPDAQDWLSSTLVSGKPWNGGEFSNPTFDRLVAEAGREPYPQRRAAEYRAANRLAIQFGAIIPLAVYEPSYAVNRRVRGIVDSPLGLQPVHGDWSQVSVSVPAGS